MSNCKIDHVGKVPKKLATIPQSQAGPWRHGCAACAYEMGYADAKRELGRERSSTPHKRHLHAAR